jgi:phage-related protein
MAATNLFQDLKKALQDFKDFLDQNVATIKPAVQALASLVPQITDLINKLIDLMNKLKTEISKLDVNAVPGLDKVSAFTTSTKTLLTTAKSLLPDEAATIDEVLSVADVVSSLPSLDQVKAEILALIDAITTHLNELKPA